MGGRKVILPVILAGLALCGLACVWLLTTDPAAGGRVGAAERAARSASITDDSDDIDVVRAAEAERARREAELARAASDAKGNAGRNSLAGDTGLPAKAIEGAPDTVINPDEVNALVPGHLLVRIIDRIDERPLPGASVYFPVPGNKLDTDGVEVKVDATISGLRKRTNKFGACIYSAKELAKVQSAKDSATSVLATLIGYSDLFEPLAVPDLTKGAEVTYRLNSAVRVTGKVREKRGGPVKYISIDVLQTSHQGSGAPQNRLSVAVDGIGEFALKVADAYTYRFEVKAAGYASYSSREFDFKRDERQVSILLEGAGGVSGLVTDTASKPIEGALVESPSEGASAKTDAQGRFVFDTVRDKVWSNNVQLRASAKGFAPQNKRVLANDRDIRIELAAEGTVPVLVVNEKNEPMAGAKVTCTYVEGRASYPIETQTTDAEGRALLSGFGAGQAVLSASFENLASDKTVVATNPVTKSPEIKLVLRAGATITGRVTSGGTPVANASITLDGAPAAATDAEGAYTLSGLQPGDHSVRVVNQFPIDDVQLRQMPVFTTDGTAFYYLPAALKLKLKLAASETADFDCPPFNTKIDRKITLHVTTQPNEPATGVQVTVKPTLGKPPAGVEAPKTIVIALDLPQGRADIPLTLIDGISYEVTLVHNRFFTATLNSASLAGVADGGAIELILERAFIIKGYVKDSQGAGIERVALWRNGANTGSQNIQTDIHGYFEFGQLRAGEYRITAFKFSYYQEQATVKVENADPDPAQIVLVGANEIRIIVRNGGSNQPGAQLDVYRNEYDGTDPDITKVHFNIGTTDANGLKYINFHWIRNYQIVASYGNLVGFANFDNLREVPEREFTITLEPGYDLRGSVVDAQTGAPVSGAAVRANIAPTGVDGRDGNFFQAGTDGDGNFAMRVPSGDLWFYVPKTRAYKALSTAGNNVQAGTTGTVLRVELRDDIEGNYAQVVSFSAPATMVAGQDYNVQVTMRNVGSTTWTSAGNQPWRLGSQAPRDNKRWGMSRVAIPDGAQVGPKDTVTFNITVKAPAAGNHEMQWQMVQDGREWFGQVTQKMKITVTAPPPPPSGG